MNPTCELEVDGGVDPVTCKVCIASGANVLVAGSAVYKAGTSPPASGSLGPLRLRNIFTEKDIILWNFPRPLEKLVEQFARLPGIGSKSAQRLAFHVLNLPMEQAQAFADAILEAKQKRDPLSHLPEPHRRRPCPICANPKRDESPLCVVADPGM